MDAFRFLATESLLVSQLSEQLKTRPEELPERVSGLVTRLRDAQRELGQLRSAQLLASGPDLVRSAEDVGGVTLVAQRLPDGTLADGIRKLALDVRGRVPAEQPAVVALAAVPDDRPVVVVAVNEAGRDKGLAAGRLAGIAAKALGGGGGGKDDVAQGGGAPLSQTGPQAVERRLRCRSCRCEGRRRRLWRTVRPCRCPEAAWMRPSHRRPLACR